MKKVFLMLLFVTALTGMYAGNSMAQVQVYSDSFEGGGGTIDPFWDTAGVGNNQNGGVELSNQQSHIGNQSVKVFSTGCGEFGFSNVQLTHHFDQAMYGDYSIWFYDPGHAGMYFALIAQGGQSIGGQDWDPTFYHAGATGGPPSNNENQTTFLRSLGWHEFKGHVDSSGTQLYIDNTLVYSDTVPYGFNNFGLWMNTNCFTEVWYDDFNMSVYPVSPATDTIPPTVNPTVNPASLWPPNHRMVDVTIQANAADNSGNVILSASVASSEPPQVDGSGNTIPDFTTPMIDQATGIITLQLRAERSGSGNGRTYTITVTATDSSGNATNVDVHVVVPHSKGK